MLLSFIGRFLACCLGTWIIHSLVSRGVDGGREAMPLTIVFASVMWSASFAKFVMPAMSAFKNQAKHDALAPLSGSYYAFDNRRVRVYLVDEVIWIAGKDVAAILPTPPSARELRLLGPDYATIPGQKLQGYTEAGLLRLMTIRNASRQATHDMIRFKHWLEKDTFPNLRRVPSSAS